ncbi:unnamed protein product [Notodromas monacha]|uniref:Uncharacterized protein n=1 Tax=Notodromas monacha TaxID=399045 RepID=A0A7R9BN21_9CRUS|nr:unnamed protein product [Notodromas monacha]CAG0917018.1 unnamed protein product [Notodromas monacha]
MENVARKLVAAADYMYKPLSPIFPTTRSSRWHFRRPRCPSRTSRESTLASVFLAMRFRNKPQNIPQVHVLLRNNNNAPAAGYDGQEIENEKRKQKLREEENSDDENASTETGIGRHRGCLGTKPSAGFFLRIASRILCRGDDRLDDIHTQITPLGVAHEPTSA